MSGEKFAKVVILFVQLCSLLRGHDAKLKCYEPVCTCISSTSTVGLDAWRKALVRIEAHVDKSSRSCRRVWTYLLQLRWSEHQRAMSIANRETNPTRRRIEILLA